MVVSRGIGKVWAKESLAGSAGETGVAAKGETKLIRIGETIAEVAGEAAVEKRIIHALTVGMKVGAGGGVIEFAEKTAQLPGTASGGKAAAFGKQVEFRDMRGTLVADDLNYGGHGVGAVESAFCAMNDFDLVHVVEGEVGKIHGAAGAVDGTAVDQELCKAGISAYSPY